MDIKSLLLTHQQMEKQYDEFHKKDIHQPYFFQIKKNQQCLFYIGSKHSFDPDNIQNQIIKKHWQEFLRQTGIKNCIALNEGGERELADTEKESIKKGGEAGLLTWLAKKDHINIYSPEPNHNFELEQLLKNFSKDEVIYYYFARLVDQWHRIGKPDFTNYLEGYLKRLELETNWTDYEFSIKNMIKIHDKTHDHKFNKDDQTCVHNDANPIYSKVASACSHIRDTFIVSEIKRLWEEGKNIFIVYGSGHFIVQRPALETLLN